MSTFQLTIDLTQAEVKFYKARLALLECRAAYGAILDKEGEPFKDVQDRLRQLDASIHYVTCWPPSEPPSAPADEAQGKPTTGVESTLTTLGMPEDARAFFDEVALLIEDGRGGGLSVEDAIAALEAAIKLLRSKSE